MSRTGLLTTWNSEHLVEMFNRKCTDIRPNHFKSALGGATYVIRFPLVFAVPATDRHWLDCGCYRRWLDCDRHRLDCDRRRWINPWYLVGYHKFKPKNMTVPTTDIHWLDCDRHCMTRLWQTQTRLWQTPMNKPLIPGSRVASQCKT